MRNLNEIIEEIKEQKEYYAREKARLKEEMSKLPKGSIQERVVKGHTYYYLQYRERGKIKQDYLGNEVDPEFRKQIEARQAIQAELKPINENLKILRRLKV